MRRLCWVVFVGLVASCTKHNPASCCTTQAQCFDVGLSQPYPCGTGLFCDSTGTCIEGNCEINGDCNGSTPFCANHICVSACSTDADCADADHPICEPDGSCGACLTADTCPLTAPVCDSMTHDCRGCANAGDCASQICDLDTGTCKSESDVTYVSDQGSDSGACTASAPCRSFAYAFTQLGTKTFVYVLGSSFSTTSSIQPPSGNCTIASAHAVITGTSSQPIFSIAPGSGATTSIQAMTLGAGGGVTYGIQTQGAAAITVSDVHMQLPFNVLSGGTLLVNNSVLDAGGTTTGTTTIQHSTLSGEVVSNGGLLTYDSNRFDGLAGRAITSTATNATHVVNSVFVSDGATSPIVILHDGDNVAFSTFVNRQSTSAGPVQCISPTTASVIDSILGWSSNSSCANTTYSLFNGASVTGQGNIAATLSTVFVNLNTDLHLSQTSPALRAGNLAGQSISTDLEGNVRPNPSGSMPDLGAYESPN